jgi:uncharacterized protein
MKHDFDPHHLNLKAFAQSQGQLTGDERLALFKRLLEETRGLGAETRVHFSAQGEMRQDGADQEQVWLTLTAEVVLSLECQRCLGLADITVSVERAFRFVATEALAEVEDEDSEEDVLVISRAFNLLELIEDELLMALPIAPMHETCPQPVQFIAADPDFEENVADRPNPFAALAQLKNKKPT